METENRKRRLSILRCHWNKGKKFVKGAFRRKCKNILKERRTTSYAEESKSALRGRKEAL